MIFTIGAAMILVLSMVALGLYYCKKGLAGRHAKRLAGINAGIFFGLLAVTTILLFSGVATAAAGEPDAEGAAAVAATAANVAGSIADNSRGLAYLAAAISTGLATVGAGIAVAITGSAALGAISEDQSLLGKSLIFVGLAEGIAIYGLIISILILGQI